MVVPDYLGTDVFQYCCGFWWEVDSPNLVRMLCPLNGQTKGSQTPEIEKSQGVTAVIVVYVTP